MAIGLEQGVAYYGQTSTYFSFSFSINLFAIFRHASRAPKTRGDQDDRKARQPYRIYTHTFESYLDEVSQDSTRDSLSPEIQEMQRAARTAYLERLARTSDRTSLQCLEKATKSRLEMAARLDRESLEKLEFATRILEELNMKTPPQKENWQYEPLQSEESSSSESKRVHSIADSPCELVFMRRTSEARSSQGFRLDSRDDKDVRDELLNSWVEQDMARVVEEPEPTGKVENPFASFGKDLDTMVTESEVLKSMSPVKVQETEEAGTFFGNPCKSFFNSEREDEDKQEEATVSVKLNPDFADNDQDQEAASKYEEEEEWTDLGEVQNSEDS